MSVLTSRTLETHPSPHAGVEETRFENRHHSIYKPGRALSPGSEPGSGASSFQNHEKYIADA